MGRKQKTSLIHTSVEYVPLPPEKRFGYNQAFDLIADILLEMLEEEENAILVKGIRDTVKIGQFALYECVEQTDVGMPVPNAHEDCVTLAEVNLEYSSC